MTTTIRRASAAALALGLLFGTVACSSDGDSDGAAKATTTAGDDSSATTADTSGTGGDDGGTGDAPADCEADEAAGSDNLSGSATVLFAADTDSGVSEADITPETTLTVSADGSSMEPSSLVVDVGQVFGIEMADDGSIDGAIVGCAGGQTLVPGTAVGFVLKEAGTYPISLDVAGTDLGTVTAE